MSDQEAVDLTRDCMTPKDAADRILEYAEALGGEDNSTALVVPLAGWGKTKGPDQTQDLRQYKRDQAGMHVLPVSGFSFCLTSVTEGSERQRRMD